MPGKNSLAGTVTAKGAQLSDNQRNNSRWAKEVTIGQQIVFFATAVSFAAGAADMSSGAVAAGFGNFGILLILIRTYFSVPLMVAGLRARDVNWAEREERRLICERIAAGFFGRGLTKPEFSDTMRAFPAEGRRTIRRKTGRISGPQRYFGVVFRRRA